MDRSGKSRNEEKKASSHYSNYYSNISTVKEIPEVSKIENKVIPYPDFTTSVQSVNSHSMDATKRKPMIKNIPFYPDPTYRPPHKLIRIPRSGPENIDISSEINIDFEENSPFQEGVTTETY